MNRSFDGNVRCSGRGRFESVSIPEPDGAESTTQEVIAALTDLDIAGSSETSELNLEEELLRPEVDLGTTDRTKQANACMLSIARASRSYLIYDPRNKVIRKFLTKVKQSFETFSANYGDMTLQVRPFELVLDGEVIYVERDWERSLAFKLFRDGVRRLIIQAGVGWEELTRLLEILSIRYVGVRMEEDDVLTLLWKAAFDHIQIEAVEGFVPVDDEDEMQAMASGEALAGLGVVRSTGLTGALRAPSDFDLPAPDLPPGIETNQEEVSEERRAAIRDEFQSVKVADDVFDLCNELLNAAADPVDMLSFEDCRHFLRETREFLLSEDDLGQLIDLNQLLTKFRNGPRLDDASRDAVDTILAGFISERALRKLIGSIDRNANEPPADIRKLLALHAADPLPSLLDVLVEERLGQPRRMTRMLVESYLPERTKMVVARYKATSDDIAADLLRILAYKCPDAVQELFNDLVHTGSRAEKIEFLNQADGADLRGGLRLFLSMLLDDPEITVRMKALEVVARQGEGGAYPKLLRIANEKAKESTEQRELDAIGRALVQCNAERSREDFVEWALPAGFFNKLKGTTQNLRRMAVAGLAELAGDADADAVLRKVATGSEDDIARFARDTLRGRRSRSGEDVDPGEAP